MAVDARLWPSRRPHADLRLRGDARGCDGSVRKELATGNERRTPPPIRIAGAGFEKPPFQSTPLVEVVPCGGRQKNVRALRRVPEKPRTEEGCGVLSDYTGSPGEHLALQGKGRRSLLRCRRFKCHIERDACLLAPRTH